MAPRTLQYVADACGGKLLHGSPLGTVARVCTDSRRVAAGDLFVPLSGERFDAHEFLDQVARAGAAATVAETNRLPADWRLLPVVAVENTRLALGALAVRYRGDFSLPVIAVAGSNGKTTTKELIAAGLREKFPTLASEASFNNDIGVPLTLLRLDAAHQAAVFEVGTNHPGELAPLVRMIQPRFGVIPSIGREHLEFFGDVAGVVAEEGWLAELLPADGCLFINGDNPFIAPIIARTQARVVKVGLDDGNDWRATDGRCDAAGMTFHVTAPRAEFSGRYQLRLHGRHQVVNALLALAVGAELGLTRGQLQAGLAGCTPPGMRLQLWETGGVRVLDDSYNANADSMLAALQTLQDFPCAGRKFAVLGDMAELGEHTASAHAEVGVRAATAGLEMLLAVGRMAGVTTQAATRAGLAGVREFADAESAGQALRELVRAGDVVLLKASRASRIERVGEILRGAVTTGGADRTHAGEGQR